jgi:hypothetical protein
VYLFKFFVWLNRTCIPSVLIYMLCYLQFVCSNTSLTSYCTMLLLLLHVWLFSILQMFFCILFILLIVLFRNYQATWFIINFHFSYDLPVMAFRVDLIISHIDDRIPNEPLKVIIPCSAHCFLYQFWVAISIIWCLRIFSCILYFIQYMPINHCYNWIVTMKTIQSPSSNLSNNVKITSARR